MKVTLELAKEKISAIRRGWLGRSVDLRNRRGMISICIYHCVGRRGGKGLPMRRGSQTMGN